MWYQRSLPIPADWSNKKILLHFGAVDYLAEIYIDGRLVGFHNGGSSPFVIDISRIAKPGNSHNLVVSVSMMQNQVVRHAANSLRRKTPLPVFIRVSQVSGKRCGWKLSLPVD